MRSFVKPLIGVGLFGAICAAGASLLPRPAPALSRGAASRLPALLANPDRRTEVALPPVEAVAMPADLFVYKPYVQLGTQALPAKAESLRLLWQTGSDKAGFAVDVSPAGKNQWRTVSAPVSRSLAIPDEAPQLLWTATLDNLSPGQPFDYRVSQASKPVFAARTRARRAANAPYRFVVFGDCSENTVGQKRIAYETGLADPDFVFITGDIVYSRGRASEYKTKFFPVYNADTASPDVGAPLIRSTLFTGVVGNHDTAYGPTDSWADGLAYFYYWNLPLNGPALAPGGPNTPKIQRNEPGQAAMQTASGEAYPRMANYGFEYGNAHWTVLDSNTYVDWSDPRLRAWLEADLQKSQSATWHFVAYHHPGFHSSDKHQDEQRMRLLSPIFEKYHVDVVWSGHVHNYQRSFPLAFAPAPGADQKGKVAGQWSLDKNYDGVKVARTNHPVYIVTGGGGAGLYDPDIELHPATWQPFTAKYAAGEHSFSLADVKGKTLSVRQVSETGKELDHWTLTK